MPSIQGRAFAKINLGLRILGLRPDGFHELRTVFQTVSLSDGIEVSWRPRARAGVRLDCTDPSLAGPENLAARAADRLLSCGRWRGRVEVSIEKRIPMGAGLGGGSADAGATLAALERLLDPRPTSLELLDAAAEVGSDVPFFLTGGRAVGVGRGEEVYPLPEPPRNQWMALVCPEVHVATAEAYRALADSRRTALTSDRKPLRIGSFRSGIRAPGGDAATDLAQCLENDFEEVVFDRFPELSTWKERLLAVGASGASMSGSGSAVFGLFEDRRAASDAVKRLRDGQTSVVAARTVGRRELSRVWKRVG